MEAEMLKGHLDAIVLAALEAGPAHGYAIIEAIKSRSESTFDLPEGTVYPALHRLELAGPVPRNSAAPTPRGRGRPRPSRHQARPGAPAAARKAPGRLPAGPGTLLGGRGSAPAAA